MDDKNACGDMCACKGDVEAVTDRTIVDTDFHLQLAPEKLLPYVEDDQLRQKLEVGGIPGNHDGWEIGYALESRNGVESHGKVVTGDGIERVKERYGLDYVVVTPGSSYFPLPSARYPVLKNAVVEAYNDYLLDQVVDVDRNIYATLLLPQWDPSAAVDEVHRLGDFSEFCGAQGFFGPYNLVGGHHFDPVLSALVEHDMPLALHSGGTGQEFNTDNGQRTAFFSGMTVEWPHYAMANVAKFVFSGAFDKFPNLELVIQEAGVNWIPLLAHRADEMYVNFSGEVQVDPRMYEMGETKLDKMPSEYVFDNVYSTTQPIPISDRSQDVSAMLTSCRASDTLMFSSDFPHHTLDTPNWLYENDEVTEGVRSRVECENAFEVFRLDQ